MTTRLLPALLVSLVVASSCDAELDEALGVELTAPEPAQVDVDIEEDLCDPDDEDEAPGDEELLAEGDELDPELEHDAPAETEPRRGSSPLRLLAADAPVADGDGPTIRVLSPPRAATLRIARSVEVSYEVADASALAEVRVAGERVSARARARGSVALAPRTGLNLIEVEATDEHGNRSVHTQSFYAAPAYGALARGPRGDAGIDGGVSLWLGQAALDSGAPDDRARPRDLAAVLEILVASLDSRALVGRSIELDQGGFKGKVEITGFDHGPYPEVELGTARGELTFTADILDVAVTLRLRGTWLEKVKVDVQATVSAARMGVASRIAMAVRARGDAAVELQELRIDFSTLGATIDHRWGLPVNWLVAAFRRTITREIEKRLAKRLAPMIDFPLAYALERTAVDRTIRLPLTAAPGGWPRDVVVEMRSELDALTIAPTRRGRAGGLEIGTRVSLTGARHVRHQVAGVVTRGQCRRPARRSRAGRHDVEARLSLDLVNQFLVGLWRAGAFQVAHELTTAARLYEPAVERFSVAFDPRLPPLLLDCRRAGVLDLEVGDVELRARAVAGGRVTEVEAHVSAAAQVHAYGDGAGGLALDLEPTHHLAIDVGAVRVDGVPSPPAEVELVETLVRVGSADALEMFGGSLHGLPLPALDLSTVAKRVPAGTVLGPAVDEVRVDEGVLVIGGRVR